ncbi:hypothetical protein FA13DRAFT_1507152 [Coprinellus micaceus]|jgi:hypothetical protein|uniref:Uncharacterized protein n=1 Tax=Coprinellus micaceus TaxID=71717 RepID=A0A4Y7SMM5_COPMI|nr:hypothetical protein FA13DRAFT_1507152 [Coprinellus micaceus]
MSLRVRPPSNYLPCVHRLRYLLFSLRWVRSCMRSDPNLWRREGDGRGSSSWLLRIGPRRSFSHSQSLKVTMQHLFSHLLTSRTSRLSAAVQLKVTLVEGRDFYFFSNGVRRFTTYLLLSLPRFSRSVSWSRSRHPREQARPRANALGLMIFRCTSLLDREPILSTTPHPKIV